MTTAFSSSSLFFFLAPAFSVRFCLVPCLKSAHDLFVGLLPHLCFQQYIICILYNINAVFGAVLDGTGLGSLLLICIISLTCKQFYFPSSSLKTMYFPGLVVCSRNGVLCALLFLGQSCPSLFLWGKLCPSLLCWGDQFHNI